MSGAIHETRARLCIGTRRGIKGNVYAEDGRMLGRVFKQSRRLRGTGGQFGEAWTARVILPDGREVAGSLGTRFTDRWHAARAIRAFWDAYPPERLAAMIDWSTDWRWHSSVRSEADKRFVGLLHAAGRAVSYFKYDEYETCGFIERYRGADPRSYRTAA